MPLAIKYCPAMYKAIIKMPAVSKGLKNLFMAIIESETIKSKAPTKTSKKLLSLTRLKRFMEKATITDMALV